MDKKSKILWLLYIIYIILIIAEESTYLGLTTLSLKSDSILKTNECQYMRYTIMAIFWMDVLTAVVGGVTMRFCGPIVLVIVGSVNLLFRIWTFYQIPLIEQSYFNHTMNYPAICLTDHEDTFYRVSTVVIVNCCFTAPLFIDWLVGLVVFTSY